MKKINFLLISILFVLNSCTKDKSIVIFFDNDVHCAIEGYPLYAGLRSSVNPDTAYIAFVSSGDYIQGGTIGSVSKGEAIATIMKNIGYDAVGLGNHEFDYTIEHLHHLVELGSLPIVNANFEDLNNNTIFEPYIIKNYGNKKIAYLGVTTPNTFYAKPAAFKNQKGEALYTFDHTNTYKKVQKYVDEARSKGADYVIVLSHLGEEIDSLGVYSHDLISKTSGIDVVLDAHTHSVVYPTFLNNKNGQPVLIAQTGTKFANAGRLVIDKDGNISASLIPVSSLTKKDDKVANVVDSIISYYDNIINEKVGELPFDLKLHDENGTYIARTKEVNSGDLVADAIRYVAKADVAIVNSGSLRNPVDAGYLTKGDLLSLCPYDNTVCSVEVTGAQLKSILSEGVKFLPLSHGDFPQVSGVKYDVIMDETPYVSNLMIENGNGNYEPVINEKIYTFASTDYVFNSEIVVSLQHNLVNYQNTGVLYSDAVSVFIKEKLGGKVPNIYKSAQSRIIIKK